MPFVSVRITREGNTPAQKATVIKEMTDTLVRVLGKDPASTMIVIDEVELDDWGFHGVPERQLREKAR